MKTVSDIGLYLTNDTNKKEIIERILQNDFLPEIIHLKGLKGAFFSVVALEKFKDEEFRHDLSEIHSEYGQLLRTMSSGEQRKALLAHLISQQPQYLLLDDVYSNVDKETRLSITEQLIELSKNTLLIQIFSRKNDLLPCIDRVYALDESNQWNLIPNLDAFRSGEISDKQALRKFVFPEGFTDLHIVVDPLVQLNSISVNYGSKQVLDRVSWVVRKGEFWHLSGPNGSGKSTLVTMITGDNAKAFGQDMVLFGRKKGSGESIWDIKKHIGYFTPSMIERFTRDETVENMIISGMFDSVGLYTVPTDLQKKTARKWLNALGPSFQQKSFHQLSVGQQRMIMVVRAMVKHPELLILDEPTIEMDDANSQVFVEMMNAIAAEKQMAIIYISHREELYLKPEKIIELVRTTNGYTGKILSNTDDL